MLRAGKHQLNPDAAANASEQGHIKARMPIGWRFAVPLAATAMIFALNGCLRNANEQEQKKGGDSVLVFQIQKDTSSVRKEAVPDVKSLKHYDPFQRPDSFYYNTERGLRVAFARAWIEIEKKESPFGLPKEVLNAYTPEQKNELMKNWELAKTGFVVALLSDKRCTPKNALETHTPEEIKRVMHEWETLKELEKIREVKIIPLK